MMGGSQGGSFVGYPSIPSCGQAVATVIDRAELEPGRRDCRLMNMRFMNRTLALVIAAGAVAAGCSDAGEEASSSEQPPGTVAVALPLCDDVPDVQAPEDWYRDTPVYVANEQPSDGVEAWARTQPGFVGIGNDRDHNGWIWVAFTEQVEQRQQDLESKFPDVGVVAIEVEHTSEELAGLQDRVGAALEPHGWGVSTGSANAKHIVTVHLGVLSEERLAALDEFRGEPICVEGADPSEAAADGPQPQDGDGWRLLGEDLVGSAYRTGVATNVDQYADLWSLSGLTTSPPEVDFETEIVVWFGAVYGSSCPIRLDDVVIDTERALVHGDFVVPGDPSICTGDARPHSYVVAIDRSALPAGPFSIQLDSEDPPRRAPEERTVVSADLSAPGAVATADQIGSDPALFDAAEGPYTIGSGGVIEPDYPAAFRFPAACGARLLGTINGVLWRTEQLAVPADLPDEWLSLVDGDGNLTVEVLLTTEGPSLTATANGYTLRYAPAGRDQSEDCP